METNNKSSFNKAGYLAGANDMDEAIEHLKITPDMSKEEVEQAISKNEELISKFTAGFESLLQQTKELKEYKSDEGEDSEEDDAEDLNEDSDESEKGFDEENESLKDDVKILEKYSDLVDFEHSDDMEYLKQMYVAGEISFDEVRSLLQLDAPDRSEFLKTRSSVSTSTSGASDDVPRDQVFESKKSFEDK